MVFSGRSARIHSVPHRMPEDPTQDAQHVPRRVGELAFVKRLSEPGLALGSARSGHGETMLSTELLLLPLMPPLVLLPLMPPQVRATRALARLRGGSTDHGSGDRPAIYPWRAGIPAFPPLSQRRLGLTRGGLLPPSPSPAGEQSGAPAGKLTMLGLAAARRTML